MRLIGRNWNGICQQKLNLSVWFIKYYIGGGMEEIAMTTMIGGASGNDDGWCGDSDDDVW